MRNGQGILVRVRGLVEHGQVLEGFGEDLRMQRLPQCVLSGSSGRSVVEKLDSLLS